MNNATLMNQEELMAAAPSAFATQPDEAVSDRYTFLPTTEPLKVLQDCGWRAYSAQQVKTRKADPKTAKHIIRLRHEDLDVNNFGVGDSIPEMLLINAHNGLSSYQLRGGIFRLVCSNGMVVSEADFGTIHLRHIGFDSEEVMEASRLVIANSSKISDRINSWRNTFLNERESSDFFTDVARLRFNDPNEDLIQSISTPRREIDRKADFWTQFNVAQENLLRGGFSNQKTGRKVRAITNISRDINLNSSLWDLANEYSTNSLN
jgi:hypothetical protein